MNGRVHLVVALSAEARPIIRRYRLKRRDDARGFTVHEGPEHFLVVSGTGTLSSAAATAFLHGFAGSRTAAWINVGIAGSRNHAVGRSVLAHKIVEPQSRRAHYPALPFRPPCPSDTLWTVDRPERTFPDDGLYDMEASGFACTATRFATRELVHALKVASDGPATPTTALNERQVETLIEGSLETLEALSIAVRALLQQLERRSADPDGLAAMTGRHRYTVSQARLLRELLSRHAAVYGPLSATMAAGLSTAPNASTVLRALEEELRRPLGQVNDEASMNAPPRPWDPP